MRDSPLATARTARRERPPRVRVVMSEVDLLELIRSRKGTLPNTQFARCTGMSESQVRALVSGRIGPGVETLARLLVFEPEVFEKPVLAYLYWLGKQLVVTQEQAA